MIEYHRCVTEKDYKKKIDSVHQRITEIGRLNLLGTRKYPLRGYCLAPLERHWDRICRQRIYGKGNGWTDQRLDKKGGQGGTCPPEFSRLGNLWAFFSKK